MAGKKKKIKGDVRRILIYNENPASDTEKEDNEILQTECAAVDEDLDWTLIRKYAEDLIKTSQSVECVGLAAPQLGIRLRIITVRMSKVYLPLINPGILSMSGENKDTETCLSEPGKKYVVTRPEEVVVRALRKDGQPIEGLHFTGLGARCVCHEIDHLNGILLKDK